MTTRDPVTTDIHTCDPSDSARKVAETMYTEGVGCIPVVADCSPTGIITDRDIATRLVAKGLDPDRTTAAEIMSDPPVCLSNERSLAEIEDKMGERQLRRVLLTDEHNRLVGLVTLGDLARAADNEKSGRVLEEVCAT